MKLTVLKNFWDKITGEPRKTGDIIDVSKERAEELLKHPLELVEVIQEESADKIIKDIVDETIQELKEEKATTVKKTRKKKTQ